MRYTKKGEWDCIEGGTWGVPELKQPDIFSGESKKLSTYYIFLLRDRKTVSHLQTFAKKYVYIVFIHIGKKF